MISVIIPTYNRASFLREAIQSVLDQDYFVKDVSVPFEILVIDDGSTDNTGEIVKSFKKKVRYHFKKHGGFNL